MAEPRDRYSAVSLTLHWLIAALILAQVLLITAHEGTDGPISRTFVQLHKATGISILVLTLARIGWRLIHPALPLPDTMKGWRKLFARTTHVLFYVFLIAMPLTGWLASSASPRQTPIEWYGLFQWPMLPVEHSRELSRGFMDWHRLLMKGLYVLIAVHVLAALKHQFVDRDDVLRRMIPFLPRRT